ncbi:MAG: hypothetical protein MI975_14905 [Cytophagales bacterium]|nr:hypothetical protein [Cytophagales bacterium]
MNFSNTTKKLITFAFAGVIAAGSFSPPVTFGRDVNGAVAIENKDSTNVKNQVKQVKASSKGKEAKSKSNAHLTYNFLYYLVAKFLETNPLSRPK